VEYQEVGGRFLSRSFFARSALVSFGIRSRSPRQKHHDTDSDFLEESKSLIFSHALGGRAGRRVRDWHDRIATKSFAADAAHPELKGRKSYLSIGN
jgi:hypothetical protein